MAKATREPLIGVVVPVNNGELYLEDALRSVFSQTYRQFEVIVVDDGSRDRSSQIARSFEEARLIRQTNQGVAAARNTGISAAQADLLTFLDSDDTWPPDRLRIQVDFLLEHPDVGFTIGRYRNFLEPGTPRPQWLDEAALKEEQTGYFPGTLIVRRATLETVGLFNPDYRVGEGAEWFVRAKETNVPMAILDDVLLHRRIHGSNLTRQARLVNSSILQALKESLDRKRKGPRTGRQNDE